jgi:ribosomal protein L29
VSNSCRIFQVFLGAEPMSNTEMHPGDVERNAKLLGLRLAAGHGQSIASLISEIRRNIAKKASALKQDAPLAVYFDAR